jgi:hypothetical protein
MKAVIGCIVLILFFQCPCPGQGNTGPAYHYDVSEDGIVDAHDMDML